MKAIAFDGNVDYENDPVIMKMKADGWKVKNEKSVRRRSRYGRNYCGFRERGLN